MAFIPTLIIHTIPAGQTFTGEAPDVVGDPVELLNGRIVTSAGVTKAGLLTSVALDNPSGLSLMYINVEAPGATQISVLLNDGTADVRIAEVASDGLFLDPGKAIIIPPGWNLRVVTTGALTGRGTILAAFGPGLSGAYFTVDVAG